MLVENLTFEFFLIFSGAAVLASLALYARQPMIIAYIALGIAIGPAGFAWVDDVDMMFDLSRIGIAFLLFLLGLEMQPQKLLITLKRLSLPVLLSSALFALIGWSFALSFGFAPSESVIIGLAMMFSSTVIGIKLLPMQVLHHRKVGETMVGVLLLQDVIAMVVLLVVSADPNETFIRLAISFIALPMQALLALLSVRLILLPLIKRFERFHEYLFLLAIGWCLGMAEASHYLGLPFELGAFIAGVALAYSPISQYIAISLKPLRDFFLVLFFFSLGARINPETMRQVLVPALILAFLFMVLKPIVFRWALRGFRKHPKLAWDLGVRLGQTSEFSFLIAFVALESGWLSVQGATLVDLVTLFGFILSSYIVIQYLPNPLASKDKLRRE